MCDIRTFDNLRLGEGQRETIAAELPMWHQDYLPCGEVVLDVGAGCGETAQFYLQHGAKKVIAIEADPFNLECLKANFGGDPRVKIIPARLDHIKIDIEGAEEGMLLETHFPHLWECLARVGGVANLWRLRRVTLAGCDKCIATYDAAAKARDVALAGFKLDMAHALDARAREYESSRSWRLTAPLRAIERLVSTFK